MVSPTIAAIATPSGSGGIGIIRISGPSAFQIGSSIFRHTSLTDHSIDKPTPGTSSILKSHHMYFGHIFDQDKSRLIDEVLIVFMKAPRTYTREDVVEIHAHAGPYILRAILELVLKNGARLAEPGEFTRRAFLNGRIDLTQSEAIIDLINAKSSLALTVAFSQVSGGLSLKIKKVRDVLISILSQLEAAIDFPDEVGDILNIEDTSVQIHSSVYTPVQEMIKKYEETGFLRKGVKIVIVGGPNVGKSSLMNQLVNKDRSIVTPIPGTTRDLIEEHLTLNGIHTILSDTAGIHDTDDPVEIIGIERAQTQIDTADLILFMIQAGSPVSENEKKIFERIHNRDTFLVVNKSDLVEPSYEPEIPPQWKTVPVMLVSALYKNGINRLKSSISNKFSDQLKEEGDLVVPNLRHKIALERCLESTAAFEQGLNNSVSCDLLAIDLKISIDALNEITGENVGADILDRIFEDFCIGK